MANDLIREFTNNLPRSLQDSVEGYVDSVSAALPEIERESSVRIAGHRLNEFLLIVAIRRIWATVNVQYWTMHDSIEIAARSHAESPKGQGSSLRGFRIGRDEIARDSEPFREAAALRRDLEKILTRLEIKELVTDTSDLSDLARKMFGNPR